jgi:hypothetical protein
MMRITANNRQKKGLNENLFIQSSGDEWNRTIDTRIFSPLLYRLSYITSSFECAKIFKFCIYKKNNEK